MGGARGGKKDKAFRNASSRRNRSKAKENGSVAGRNGGLMGLPVALQLNPTLDTESWRAAGGKPTCQGCVAHCCRYVSVEIDKPDTKWQYDQIFWMLLHANVGVYVETDGNWYVEFASKCDALSDANLCRMYEDRPRLCREYSNETCPVWGEGSPYKHRWDDAESFAAYLQEKGVDWSYKDGDFFDPGSRIKLRKKKKKSKGKSVSSKPARPRTPAPSVETDPVPS